MTTLEDRGHHDQGLGEFQHEALFYDGDDGFLAGTVPFVLDGLAAGEPVLVVVPERRLEALRAELGDDAGDVAFADMNEVGRNPARIIPAWRDFLDRHGGGDRPVRGIGEPVFASRSPSELVECQFHEDLLNVAFTGSASWQLLCPYDTRTLDPAVLDEATRSHRYLRAGVDRWPSEAFREPASILGPSDKPLPSLPDDAATMSFGRSDLRAVRHFVADCAAQAAVPSSLAADFVLAVNEITTNSVLHGGGGGVLRCWTDQASLVCEVSDGGRITEPLVGRKRPPTDRIGGRGLWLANQICDLVQVRSFPTGNVVRLHLHRR